MRFLRLMVAGLIAVTAVVAVLVTAAVVFLTGLAAYVLQLFGRRGNSISSRPAPAPNRPPARPPDDVIDVVATKVPDETAER